MLRLLLTLVVSGLVFGGCADSKTENTMGSDTESINWMDGAAAAADEVHPLLPGMRAASFSAELADGSVFRFDAESRDQGAILIFYRGGWCPYCNMQLSDLRNIDDELVSLGYDLYYISADRPEKLSEGSAEENPPYTLISDNELDVAKAYGIAYKVDEDLVARYLKGGLDLEDASGHSHHLLPAPSAFVIDSEGIIQFQYTNPDYRVRVNGEVLLAAARAASDTTE